MTVWDDGRLEFVNSMRHLVGLMWLKFLNWHPMHWCQRDKICVEEWHHYSRLSATNAWYQKLTSSKSAAGSSETTPCGGSSHWVAVAVVEEFVPTVERISGIDWTPCGDLSDGTARAPISAKQTCDEGDKRKLVCKTGLTTTFFKLSGNIYYSILHIFMLATSCFRRNR